MAKLPDKAFLSKWLVFRLDVLGNEIISGDEAIVKEVTGCTVRQLRVLRLIDDFPGITFIDICGAAGLERSLTSRLIRQLLALGLVKREGAAADARRYELTTTKLGKERRLIADSLVEACEDVLVRPLSRNELEVFNNVLERLALWIRSAEYQKARAQLYPRLVKSKAQKAKKHLGNRSTRPAN